MTPLSPTPTHAKSPQHNPSTTPTTWASLCKCLQSQVENQEVEMPDNRVGTGLGEVFVRLWGAGATLWGEVLAVNNVN